MRRLILLATIGLAGLVGGFHEWTPPADAAATCTITQQFANNTQVSDDGTNWFVIMGPTLTASCSTKWYVEFTGQCKSGQSSYTQCVDAVLCFTAPGCTPNAQGWGAGTTHTYDEPTQSPTNFTGYFDTGDGFNKPGSVCDYVWRVKETFKNGFTGAVIKTAFAPEGFCIG